MSSIIFIPNLARDLNASYLEVGVIVAAYGFMVFLSSYIFGRAADMHGYRIFLRIGLIISALSFFIQIFAVDPVSLILVRALTGFSIGLFPAALIAYVHESKRSLGKFSSYGSLGWAFGSLLAGFITIYHEIFILGSFLFFIAFLTSLRMPDIKNEPLKVPFFPIKLIKENSSVYISFFFRHLGATSIWAIFPLFLLTLGADKFWIGVIYFTNSMTQVVVMRYLDRFKSESLVRMGLILSIIVFFSFTLAQNYYQILPIQVLLAFSWSCLYVGSLMFLTEKNIEKATSVGILNSVIGLSGIFGPLLAGIISEFFGLTFVMYIASVLALIGLSVNLIGYNRH